MRSADTHPDAEQVQIKLLRDATVASRVSLALSLSRTVMELSWRALADAHPTANADELAVLFVTHCYGPELGEGLRCDLEARRLKQRPRAGAPQLTQ
jgi:hypothetical protein